MGPKYEVVSFLVGKLHLFTFFHDTGLYMPTPSDSQHATDLICELAQYNNEPHLWFWTMCFNRLGKNIASSEIRTRDPLIRLWSSSRSATRTVLSEEGDKFDYSSLTFCKLKYLTQSISPATGLFVLILPVLATFWNAKAPIFFCHFPTPNFCRTVPIELMFTNVEVNYSAKTRY